MIAAWLTYGSESSSNEASSSSFVFPTRLTCSPSFLSALHMKGNWAWRLPVVFQAASSVLVLLFIYPAPESPRWLTYRGRDEEALAVLARYVRPLSPPSFYRRLLSYPADTQPCFLFIRSTRTATSKTNSSSSSSRRSRTRSFPSKRPAQPLGVISTRLLETGRGCSFAS